MGLYVIGSFCVGLLCDGSFCDGLLCDGSFCDESFSDAYVGAPCRLAGLYDYSAERG
jgi:hypothetical protein